MVEFIYDLDRAPMLVPTKFAEEGMKILGCENRNWDVKAISYTGDWGLWQLNRQTWEPLANSLGFQWAQMLEPGPNTEVAMAIWSQTKSFKEWSCRP